MWRAIIKASACFALLTSSAVAETRIALVVGNSEYQNVSKLPNPVGDARLVAETLAKLGFRLVGGTAQLDLDKVSFDLAVQAFGKQLMGADVGPRDTDFRFGGRITSYRSTLTLRGRPMSTSRWWT